MYLKVRLIFQIFLWLLLSAVTGMLFYSIISIIFTGGSESFFWINIVIFFINMVIIILYFNERLHSSLKIMFSFLFMVFFIFFIQHFIIYFIKPKSIQTFTNLQLFLLVSFLFLVTRFFLNIIKRGFDRIYHILDNEKNFSDMHKYIEWAGGQIDVKDFDIDPIWFVRLITNTFFILLPLSFLSIAKNPQTKWFHSLFLLCLFFGGIGIYLILYQMSSILRWKMLGYKMKRDIVSNWNKFIITIICLVCTISLLIPWNFKVFPTQWLTRAVNDFFAQLALQFNLKMIQTQPDIADSNIDFAISDRFSEVLWNTVWKVVKYLVYGILFILAFLFLSGIIGGIISLLYMHRKKPAWSLFFIQCFNGLKATIIFIFKIPLVILLSIWKIFFGGGEEKERKRIEALEKKFYAFFDEMKNVSDKKLEEIRTIVKDFVRMVDTASRTVAPYYFHMGPTEYTQILCEHVPDLRNDFLLIVNIFNESRYSLHILTKEKCDDFHKRVDFVVRALNQLYSSSVKGHPKSPESTTGNTETF